MLTTLPPRRVPCEPSARCAASHEAEFAASRGAELLRAGDFVGAEAAFTAILRRAPASVDALLGLALSRSRRGEPRQAMKLLHRCCRIAPDRPEMWDALGMTHASVGEHALAETAFAAAQCRAPEVLDIALRRGGAALCAGTAEAELARLEAALARDPLDAVQLTARGVLLCRLGRREEGIDVLEVATTLAPGLTGAALEYAVAVTDRDPAIAEPALRRAIALLPEQESLRNNLAVVLMRRHGFREAREILETLVIETGEQPGTLCNLSNTLVSLGLQREAVGMARRAIAAAPRTHLAWRALSNALAYSPEVSAATMLEAASGGADCIIRTRSAPTQSARDPTRRLRLGLLSATLNTHPVGWLTVAGFEHLDPASYEIVCIAQPRSGDPIARRFRAIASEWHVIAEGGVEAVADQVRALGLDMLIDLGGYGDRGWMAACAQRLAPVQLKWVGMQNHSTGLPEMDWFITDRWETPAGFEQGYSERLLRLRDGYVCYSPPSYAPDVTSSPALRRGAVTFGCLNNLAKITSAVIAAWSRVLHRVHDSRLVLKTHQFSDAATRARVSAAFLGEGIAPERLILRGSSPHRALLAEYGEIDVVLDPFPYTGGLTTCEALWMGVPTVTLSGEIFAARHATSHMTNVGLPDWVANDIAAYEDLAVVKVADVEALAALRSRLRAQMRASPLCDAPRFGQSLDIGLRHAWRAWCEVGRPEPQLS